MGAAGRGVVIARIAALAIVGALLFLAVLAATLIAVLAMAGLEAIHG